MALLNKHSIAPASQAENNSTLIRDTKHDQLTGNGTQPEAAPADTLHTLRARLQAQLDNSDNMKDPEGRSLLESVRRRLGQVEAALARIDEGQYGVCTDCNKTIENDRLALLPFSVRCASCQTVAEWRGHRY